jgi:hypothetical protein
MGGGNMRRHATVATLLVGLVLAAAGALSSHSPAPAARSAPAASQLYGRLPLSFEAGAGGFSARGPGYAVQLQGDAARLMLGAGRASLGLRLHGARTGASGEGRELLPGRVNHLTGGDPAGWRVDVPTYGRVRYAGVYDGIDVDWYGTGGQLEFDLVVAPGADPALVDLGFEGADDVHLDAAGSLVVSVAGDALVQRPPVAYQEGDGGRRSVAAHYVARTGDRFGVVLGDYDRSRPLVIDPVVVYSTLLGGFDVDEAYDVQVDGAGSLYVAGYTASGDFPTAGAVQPFGGTRDAVVVKLNPAGTALVYSTFLGAGGEDYGLALAIDGSGAAYVAGFTTSRESFPLRSPAQPRYGGGSADAFVVKLEPSGAALAYGTYLGGAGRDTAAGIAVDGSGNAYVTGTTTSTDFPTAQARQPVNAGEEDAFVARLGPTGVVVYATYLGGSGEDHGMGVDVDRSGNAVVVGITESVNFPTAQPVQASLRGYGDGFVTRLDAGGANLLYSTYLGGTDHEVAGRYSREGANAVAVDSAGNAYVTGLTDAYDFPTHRAMSPTSGNGYDAFITKLSPAGGFVYSTYLGSSAGFDAGEDIAVDAAGNAHIAGWVAGSVPAVKPLQGPSDYHDAFVTKLNADGSAILFSTNLGGGSDDLARGIAVDGTGAAYVVGFYNPVTGFGQSGPFPFPTTAGALQPQPRGTLEMFVMKIGGLQGAPVIAGSTWYADGSKSRSGPAGTAVTAYAVGGIQDVPYQLVLANGGNCANTVAVLNATTVQAGPSGVIGRVRGTVPAGTPPGTYDICFRHGGGATATGAVGFIVQ